MHIKPTRLLRALGLLGLVLAIGNPAQAANIHFKGGKNAGPSFTDEGLTLSATGDLAGLGNGDITVDLTAKGLADVICVNPGRGHGGNHQPPGQNAQAVSVSGSALIPDEEFQNGQVSFEVETAPPGDITGSADCPNPKWKQQVVVAFTSAIITIKQGSDVLTADCTFASPTTDGKVPQSDVTCDIS